MSYMPQGIVGCGVYLPYYRIKLTDIAEAWNRKDSVRGEKTVPAPDEITLTMARNATMNALKHANIDSNEIGAVYFCSISSMIEGSYAQDIAVAADLKSDSLTVDLHGSPRSYTAAIQMCLDSLQVNRFKYGLVIGADILIGGMGTSSADIASEYVSAAGAGTLVLGNEGQIAEMESSTSYMTGIKERWRAIDEKFPKVGDGRFIRDLGYISHVGKAGKALLEKTGRPIDKFTHIILQQPHFVWVQRALGGLGVAKDMSKQRLSAPGMHIGKFGDLGCACLPVALAEVLDQAKPDESILTISYGSGGSDALSWLVKPAILQKREHATPVEKFLKNKEYINYTTMLRYNKVIKQFV
jgi:hydroxymethylglutaryl-CoA synthase